MNNSLISAAAAIATCYAAMSSVVAQPVSSSAAIGQRQATLIDSDERPIAYHGHRRRGNGGYKVNRYGFGNYVGGRSGGFAGYPAGSAGAQVYKQRQEWKCEAAPERC